MKKLLFYFGFCLLLGGMGCAPESEISGPMNSTSREDLLVQIQELRSSPDTNSLHIEGNRITDEDLALLRDCPPFEELTLERCRAISDRGLKNLAGTPLRGLTLLECGRITESGLSEFLETVPQLEGLVIYNCRHITENIAATVGKMRGLRFLVLGFSRYFSHGDVTEHLTELRDLQTLMIYTDRLPQLQNLQGLENLEQFYLQGVYKRGNPIRVEDLKPLESLPLLREIGFSRCPNLREDELEAMRQRLPHCNIHNEPDNFLMFNDRDRRWLVEDHRKDKSRPRMLKDAEEKIPPAQ